MTTASPQKMTLDQLRAQMQVFLDFRDVERTIQAEVEQTVSRILLSKAQNGGRASVDVLADYLNAPNMNALEERLKVVIGFAHGSLERIKRIYETIFPGASWSRIRRDEDKRRRIAAFLITPQAEEIFVPSFIKNNFSLPDNWIELLQDEDYLQAVVRNTMQSKYAANMGFALEEQVRGIVASAGYTAQKGKVGIVDNKEVDIAIPDIVNPRILIMSSYQVTTGSSQSSKASEQAGMYEAVQRHNRSRAQRNAPNVVFVNVIDGGGWLSRPNDLQTMWDACDYCFSRASLDGLRAVLARHL